MSKSNREPRRSVVGRVNVYNEAIVVFLYDESNLARLLDSNADFESGYAETESDTDKSLKKLAKDGILVAYELIQDDEIVVDVIVGPPLSKAEIRTMHLAKPQTANLRLPSGQLRIDSANTLPANAGPGEDAESPGRVTVASGDYVVSLYRTEFDSIKSNDRPETTGGEKPNLPNEVLVLTPLAETKPVKSAKALLRVQSATSWVGRYKIEHNVFRGKALSNDPSRIVLVNIDRAAETRLQLTIGSVLSVEINGYTFEALFCGEADAPGQIKLKSSKRCIAFRMNSPVDQFRDDKIVLERLVASVPFPSLGVWVTASVTVLDEIEPT